MTLRTFFVARLLAICVVVALALAGTAMGEVSRVGLVAEYHFDGDAKDSSGNGNDGQIFGATFVEGKFGQALSFDGANNYVNVAGVWGGTSWKEATIEAWVSTKTTSGDFQAIVSSTSADFVHLQLNSWGNIAIFTDKIKPYIALPIISQKPTGVWRRVAISIKSGNTKLYENGVEVGSDSGTFSYIIPAMELHIGNGYQNGRFFNGLIDEVRVYNRALSAEEIKVNYEARQTPSTLTKTPTPTSIKQEQTATTPSEPASSAVLLHGEKTDVVLGEDVLLKLSAVNLITKPPMTVQVILYPPSGMSVTSSEFVKSGAGIYTTTYSLNRGEGRDIEVRIKTNQVGDFNVKGRIVYYFGDNQSTAEDHTLNLPIKVRKEGVPAENEGTPAQKTPGFGVISGLSVILFIFLKKRGIKE